jgi:hypothetical protein
MVMRSRQLAFVFVVSLPLVALIAILLGDRVDADLENNNQVFTSKADGLRMIVPRGWRPTDQPSYPGLLLWMMRSQPEGQIVLTAEAFTRELYCSWPAACRARGDAPPATYACALRDRLTALHFKVGPSQAGPKETELAGLPSVWFEYDDGKHFLRQAVAISNDRAFSLVLVAPTNDARTAHSRPFEQALRTLRLLGAQSDAADAAVDIASVEPASTSPGDAGALDATALADASTVDAGTRFESAPAPKLAPVGPCPQ